MKVLYSFRVLLILFLFTSLAYSQEMQKDQLFYIHEEVAKFDKIDQYDRTAKEFNQMMMDSKLDVPFVHAAESDDGHFLYLVPLKNYADIDKMTTAFNNMFAKADKDKMNKNMQESSEATEYTRELIYRLSNDLSYDVKSNLDMSKSNFIHWDYYTIKPEDRKQVMDLAAKFKKLYQDKKIGTPYSVWLADMGDNNNLIIVSTMAKDAASFYQQNEIDNKALGKEGDDLWNQMIPMVSHFDHKNGHTRPDLSYINGDTK